MNVPTLLITFNRLDYTRQMLKALKEAEVENLYVFKDGPRPGNKIDKKASKEIEELIEQIDWKCDVKKLFLNNNLGCGYGPFTAISWAFSQEEELIILEDDCVPTYAFFRFCEDMLTKYKDETRVSVISGRCQLYDEVIFTDKDYIFTQYAPTLGWATWKRVWDDFDIQMRNVKGFFSKGGFSDEFSTVNESSFMNRRFKRDFGDNKLYTHSWDNQFGYHSRVSGGLRISPASNLIKYIGFEGTHSGPGTENLMAIDVDESFIASRHPKSISNIQEYDRKYFYQYVKTPITLSQRIAAGIKFKLKRLFSK